jgi:hypothetical protein
MPRHLPTVAGAIKRPAGEPAGPILFCRLFRALRAIMTFSLRMQLQIIRNKVRWSWEMVEEFCAWP